MSLSFTEQTRGSWGTHAFKTYQVTSDGTSTTIEASDLDMHYIESAMLCPKAALTGSATWNPASIADGNEEAKEIIVTGAALGDKADVAFSLDVSDLTLTGDVTGAATVTAVLANSVGSAVDLDTGTIYARVSKRMGLSTTYGTFIVFSPALTSGDIFHLWVIGW